LSRDNLDLRHLILRMRRISAYPKHSHRPRPKNYCGAG